jgi:hypothetical protein
MSRFNVNTPRPIRMVFYRGKLGVKAVNPAMIVTTLDNLEQAAVDAGDIPGLDSSMHAHLRVFSAGPEGGYTEYNVPHVSLVEDPEMHDNWPEGPATGTWAWPDLNRKWGAE